MAASIIRTELRPCIINGKKKGLCHGIFQISEIYKPSLMVGGHNGGVQAYPTALIEDEAGYMMFISPLDIRFIDSRGKFEELDWSVEETPKE